MTDRLFLIAGEPSGDALGGPLMAALREETGGDVAFDGIGGPLMEAQGLRSVTPQSDLAVMGLVEVLPRLPALLRTIRATAEAVVAARPDALVTIDSPSFGLRVADRVRARDSSIRLVHYVAPSVWAWRPGRAAKLARRVDRVLALLPFEPPYFEAHGLPCDFVGHPAAAAAVASEAEAARFRERFRIGGRPLLLALPGSRMREVRAHAGPMGETVALLKRRFTDLAVVTPTVPHVAGAVREATRAWAAPPLVLDPREAGAEAAALKAAAFAAADAALSVSGTVTLEVAAAGTPQVVIYRANALTAAIVRRLVRVDTATLVNLVVGRKAIPEFLQERLRPEDVAAALEPLMRAGPQRAAQVEAAEAAMAALGRGGEPPARRAARSVLTALGRDGAG